MTNVPPPPPPPGDVPPPAGNVPPAGSVPPASNVPPAYSAPPPTSGAAPYSTPGPGPSPYASPTGGTAPKQALSLTSFIVGLAGLLILSWIPILGLLAGIAAVVLGFMAKGREPGAPSWMWIVGIISGFITILLNLIFSFLILILPIMLIGTAGSFPTAP